MKCQWTVTQGYADFENLFTHVNAYKYTLKGNTPVPICSICIEAETYASVWLNKQSIKTFRTKREATLYAIERALTK